MSSRYCPICGLRVFARLPEQALPTTCPRCVARGRHDVELIAGGPSVPLVRAELSKRVAEERPKAS